MSALIVIPARMAASRLPGKPLADIAGVPMIVRVVRIAEAADVGPVAVAAADREIAEAVEAAGARAILTDPDLPSGSDRVWAGAQAIDPDGAYDVIVNLQGDMPTLAPDALRKVVSLLDQQGGADIGTLVAATDEPEQRDNPNVVKAVVAFAPGAQHGRALYFTRAAAPSGDGPVWHHVGVYAYRRAALARFTGIPTSPLERRERLEQLRALEAGMRIDAALIDTIPDGVDTPDDLARARAHFETADVQS